MRLFKYVRPERVDILENQQITFTPPKEFNDALDTRPRVVPLKSLKKLKIKTNDYRAEVAKSLPLDFQMLPRRERRRKERELFKGSVKEMQKQADKIARKIEEDVYSGINQLFGVLCLTGNSNHRLMWENYADGDRGFAIEFDAEQPRFGPNVLHQVAYSEEPPTYDPSNVSDGWWKIKSKDWEYENEYRIVFQLKDCEPKAVNGKIIYLKHLPRNCIKSVFMGLAMGGEMKKRLKDVCQPSGIKLFEAIISNGKAPYEFREV